MGQVGRLAGEDILHDKQVQLSKGFFDVIAVGIRHHRVLPHDVYGVNFASQCGMSGFHDGQPHIAWELFNFPGLGRLLAQLVIGYLLITR